MNKWYNQINQKKLNFYNLKLFLRFELWEPILSRNEVRGQIFSVDLTKWYNIFFETYLSKPHIQRPTTKNFHSLLCFARHHQGVK